MAGRIIERILLNNGSFVSSHPREYFEPHMHAQHPDITLVSCCDSRVQPTILEPDPIDRVFTVETIGNQMASAQGSVDYGVLHLHTPVLLILGHTDCGAVKAFMKGYESENDAVRRELDNLRRTIPCPSTGGFEEALLQNVVQNVVSQVSCALERYGGLVEDSRLTVIGAVYDFADALGRGCGRIVILSVNGVTGRQRLESMPQLAGINLDGCLPDVRVMGGAAGE
jgi:carbonic anhydrase